MKDSGGQTLLQVENLNTFFKAQHVVKDFTLSIQKGETIAIVGDSGSGKTVAFLSILGALIEGEAVVTKEKCAFVGSQDLNDKRGKELSMVFQNPRLSLNPVKKCGFQISRVIQKHLKVSKDEAKERTIGLLKTVELSDFERIYKSYPHEVSGGELQRVMIALGLSCQPKLLILDEPAASLDKIVQFQIIELLKKIKVETDVSIVLISHDLEMLSEIADRVCHVENGTIISTQVAKEFFLNPKHPSSKRLIENLKAFRNRSYTERKVSNAVMKIEKLMKTYDGGKEAFKDITFELTEGERLGIIGESGSGKSSLGRCIAGILKYDQGQLISAISRDKICYVFQDAFSALDPELTVRELIDEVLRLKQEEIFPEEVLKEVHLDAECLEKKSHQLSGGQRQRVNLARALASKPEILICDEITSGLDLTIQFEIIELLMKKFKSLSIIFISHDISLVKYFCHNVLILREGKIVDQGTTQEIFEESSAKYTQDLINSMSKVKYFLNI